jgi:hypothetical protein
MNISLIILDALTEADNQITDILLRISLISSRKLPFIKQIHCTHFGWLSTLHIPVIAATHSDSNPSPEGPACVKT